ncbi:MAG: hypothetical protein ACK5CY_05380 [Bacteroidia bacterium]
MKAISPIYRLFAAALISAILFQSCSMMRPQCQGIKAHPDYKRNGAKNW